MKSYTQFICQQCGYKSPSFLGKCPSCDTWGSLVETIEKDATSSWGKKINKREGKSRGTISKLNEVKTKSIQRIQTGLSELDQVLGGIHAGIVPGSLILLAGDPGIGKSTLALQMLSSIGGVYVSGEESAEQVKLRSERLSTIPDAIFILPETHVETILDAILKVRTQIRLVIIDSIQTLWSEELVGAPGSVGQVRECTLKLLDLAKRENLAVVLIGHVTKEGTIAGPKVLEHIVDTVLYLEGERFQSLRLLRAVKNRYGPVDEVGIFSMEEKGMKEVANPSELFLGVNKSEAGSVVVATLEGTRPILIEIQALTVPSQLPLPRRVGTGINTNRLQMLIAILQKHLRLPLGNFDIFVNAASGMKVYEPAVDLGICLAIVSSFKNISLPPKTIAIGEVGLLGEIRNVIGLDRRIKEAKRLGFTVLLSPKTYTHITEVIKRMWK